MLKLLNMEIQNLHQFGKLIDVVEGNGFIQTESGDEFKCEFYIGQVADSNLYGICYLGSHDCLNLQNKSLGKLIGKSNDGRNIIFEGIYIKSSHSHSIINFSQLIILT